MKNIFAFFAALMTFALSAASLPTAELLPFTFAGRIVDYAHIAYNEDCAVEVRVKTQNEVLLAKTTTWTRGNASFNYVIDIPLASQALAGHVNVGDEVVFEFVDYDGKIYTGIVTSESARIGNPGQVSRVDVILATDDDKDGVPDEYLETLEYAMWKHGISTYDANADYDNDGKSNYAEYLVGTNPFDATDKFSVKEMATKEGYEDYYAIKVQLHQGRTYTVATSTDLGKDVTEWTQTEFMVDDPSSSLQKRVNTGTSETRFRVFFMKREGSQRFWNLRVE